ncbi:hypothetical protein VMCG_10384 [Cytospora schulzeri]|uniref:Uncharacterized protein n=1 Tax=Cytospora schulzeri TaxID=448051 RepID=A0A423VC65_9PEZI|nr:hypothetical protein VMCG_10384 [Valsa malicola]
MAFSPAVNALFPKGNGDNSKNASRKSATFLIALAKEAVENTRRPELLITLNRREDVGRPNAEEQLAEVLLLAAAVRNKEVGVALLLNLSDFNILEVDSRIARLNAFL